MINLLAAAVRDKLAAQRYPAAVEYRHGSDVTPENYPHGLIRIERDPQANDVLEPPQGSRHREEYRFMRPRAARATLYIQSPEDGATDEEHEAWCEAYVDAFLIAVAEWCSEAQRGSNPFRLGGMRYLNAQERAGEQNWPGLAYRIQFSINAAVIKVSFDGLTRETFPMSGSRRVIANRTQVQYPAGSDLPAATNCGPTD